MRYREGSRAARRRDLPLSTLDGLLRPALEMAVIVGRRGEAEEPPLPVPRGLRPFLRFTRLPDRALTATRRVLDDDDEFRSAVRDATSEEVVGRAGWLFLDRPAGWEDELAELAAAAAEAAGEARSARSERETSRRLAAVEESLRRAEAELGRRVSELAEAKEQLAIERRARRRSESETGRLRKRVAGLESDLDEGRRQAAGGDVAAELHDLRQRFAELEAEHRRAQEQVHQLEQERSTAGGGGGGGDGGAPPSGAVPNESSLPGDRVVDVEALADAVAATVSTLAGALATAARQLAPFAPPAPPSSTAPAPAPPPPPSARASAAPSRPAPQPVPLPPGVWDDSVEAADHLVRVQGVLVVVDGYNVTKLARPELPLPEQRRWLADAAAELAARTGAHLELVFDGAGHGASAPAERERRAGVQVRYSPDGVEADDVVIGLVAELAAAHPMVVASDDRRVQEASRRRGANVITVAQLLAVLRRR